MTTRTTMAAFVDDRRSRRTDVRIAALIGAGLGPKIEAMALNISAHGIMLEIDVPNWYRGDP